MMFNRQGGDCFNHEGAQSSIHKGTRRDVSIGLTTKALWFNHEGTQSSFHKGTRRKKFMGYSWGCFLFDCVRLRDYPSCAFVVHYQWL